MQPPQDGYGYGYGAPPAALAHPDPAATTEVAVARGRCPAGRRHRRSCRAGRRPDPLVRYGPGEHCRREPAPVDRDGHRLAVRSSACGNGSARPTSTGESVPHPERLPDQRHSEGRGGHRPGEYALRPTGSLGGYWERLSCLTGDFECITANSIVQGNSYVTVLPGDVALRIEDLELSATGNPAPATGPARPLPPVSASEDTDAQGFVGIPEARCNHTNPAVAIGQTADSLVVVCETGAGRYYYKGVRTNDGAAIEIDDPVPSGDGFTATNAGVQYSISSSALVISEGSTVLAEEPMLQYWSR